MALEEIPVDIADVDSLAGSPRATPLQIVVREQEGRTQVELAGELDDATASLFHEQLLDATANGVVDMVLDLSLLTFVDSTGLSLFVTLHKHLVEQGHQLTIRNPTPMARRLFEITGLDAMLRIEPTL